MFDDTPEALIRETAFRNEAMDMWIPFEGSPKGMKDANKAWNKVFRFVEVMEHTQDNTADSLKETVKERTVFQKEVAQFIINGENTVPVCAADQFKSDLSGALLGVFDPAGGAETAFAAKRNELQVAAVWAGIHGAAKRRITTIDHLRDIFHFNISGMKCILNDFIIVFKNLL